MHCECNKGKTMRRSAQAWMAGAVAIAAGLSFGPIASSAPRHAPVRPRASLGMRSAAAAFTPANADPRLLALISRLNTVGPGMRFTPATSTARVSRSITVAVRSRTRDQASPREALVAAPANGNAPSGYNLGLAVGWRGLAVSSDVARIDQPGLGGRAMADVGLSYSTKSFTTRVGVGADRATGDTPRPLAQSGSYNVDLAGSYSLSRNIDVTAGYRYRAIDRDRLAPLADNRKDSQAVYLGTAFRF